MFVAREELRHALNRRRRKKHHRDHQRPRGKPRLQPIYHERAALKRVKTRDRGGDRGRNPGLDKAKQEMGVPFGDFWHDALSVQTVWALILIASVVDLTFASVPPRVLEANVK